MPAPVEILAQCMEQLIRAEASAVNSEAFRKQFRLLAKAPGVLYALSKARDAPAEKPAPKKRTTKLKVD